MAAESWEGTGPATTTRGEGGPARLPQRREERGELRLQVPDGTAIFIRYNTYDVGNDLKIKIADKLNYLNMNTSSFWLEHDGKAILENEVLNDQGLWGQDAKLIVHARLPGGAPPPVFNAMLCGNPINLAQRLNEHVDEIAERQRQTFTTLTSNIATSHDDLSTRIRALHVSLGDLGGASVADRLRSAEKALGELDMRVSDGNPLLQLEGRLNALEAATHQKFLEIKNVVDGLVADSTGYAKQKEEKEKSYNEELKAVLEQLHATHTARLQDVEAKAKLDVETLYVELRGRLEQAVGGIAGVASAQHQHQQQVQRDLAAATAMNSNADQSASGYGISSADGVIPVAGAPPSFCISTPRPQQPPLPQAPLQQPLPQHPPSQPQPQQQAPQQQPLSGTSGSSSTARLPQSVPDPWAQSRSAGYQEGCAAAGAPLHQPMPNAWVPPGLGSFGGSASMPGRPSMYKVSNKDWGDKPKLDLSKPTEFINWYDQALDHLAPPERGDVRMLLKWAETQPSDIGAQEEQMGAQAVGLIEGPAGASFVSSVILAALRHIISPTLLAKARAVGEGRGLQLWRKLFLEARGNAPALAAAKALRWTDPPTSKDMTSLWSDLDDWLLLGTEIEQGGINKMERPAWLVLQSFKKLLPIQLREQLKIQLPSAGFDEEGSLPGQALCEGP